MLRGCGVFTRQDIVRAAIIACHCLQLRLGLQLCSAKLSTRLISGLRVVAWAKHATMLLELPAEHTRLQSNLG